MQGHDSIVVFMFSVGPSWDSQARRVLDHPLSVVVGDLPVPPLGYVAVLVPLLTRTRVVGISRCPVVC